MKQTLLILPAAILLANAATAQHYFNAPQLLNPAMTGFTPADVRASLNVNSNFGSWRIPAFFATNTFAADAPILKGKLPKGDAMGIGIFSSYAFSSIGDNYDYTGKSIGLSAAYHKALGKKKDQYLSVGLRGSTYASALNGQEASGYVYRAGAMYTRPVSTSVTVYGGYSLGGAVNSRDLGHNLYVGGVWNVNKRLTLNATALMGISTPPPQAIAWSNEYVFTAMAGYILKPDSKNPTTIYFGGTYDYLNTLSPYVGIEKHGFRLALSPRMNVGPYSRPFRVNSYEISLMWSGHFKKHSDKQKEARPFPKIY